LKFSFVDQSAADSTAYRTSTLNDVKPLNDSVTSNFLRVSALVAPGHSVSFEIPLCVINRVPQPWAHSLASLLKVRRRPLTYAEEGQIERVKYKLEITPASLAHLSYSLSTSTTLSQTQKLLHINHTSDSFDTHAARNIPHHAYRKPSMSIS
jgi:hypothetical protein